MVGAAIEKPQKVESFDELVLVVRQDAGLQFDDNLPGYHLYGTDIAQTALAAGRTAYAFDGPVIHNSMPIRRLDRSYRRAYDYMRGKWAGKLPILTSVMPLTPWGWPLKKHWMKTMLKARFRSCRLGVRHPAPQELARELGFEGVTDESRPAPATLGERSQRVGECD